MPRVRWITSRAILSEPEGQEIALEVICGSKLWQLFDWGAQMLQEICGWCRTT
jgi:hypothetical protein